MCCCVRICKPGDLVTITDGTFRGMEGRCIEVPENGQVRLNLVIFGRTVSVDVQAHMIHSWQMTEAEYLKSDHVRCLLSFLRRSRWSGKTRKALLFGCGCLRLGWDCLDHRLQDIVLTTEQFADRPPDRTPRAMASRRRFARLPEQATLTGVMRQVGHLACNALTSEEATWDLWSGIEYLGWSNSVPLIQLLRDVFGNPFRPVSIDGTWLSWQGGLIPQLAHDIYNERRFDEMPVLADALEDAGCADPAILDHCRLHPLHTRGCWLLDQLLEKE